MCQALFWVLGIEQYMKESYLNLLSRDPKSNDHLSLALVRAAS